MSRPSRAGARALTEELLDVAVGPIWTSRLGVTELDFSGPQFDLETLQELIDPVVSKIAEKINIKNLRILDLTNNSVQMASTFFSGPTAVSKFSNLVELRLRGNGISRIELDLAALQVLDLSDNYLTQIPNLMRTPDLKALDLHKNYIENPSADFALTSTALEQLNLASNAVEIYPSKLYQFFVLLRRRAPNLRSLQMEKNPVARDFPEYTVWAAFAIPALKQVDNSWVFENESAVDVFVHDQLALEEPHRVEPSQWILREQLRNVTVAEGGYFGYQSDWVFGLQKYDGLYVERTRTREWQVKSRKEADFLPQGFDHLKEQFIGGIRTMLLAPLEDIKNAKVGELEGCQNFFAGASAIAQFASSDADWAALESRETPETLDECLFNLFESAVHVVGSCSHYRVFILRGLAKLSWVGRHGIGVAATTTLGKLCTGSESAIGQESLEALQEFSVQHMKDVKLDSPEFLSLIRSLAEFPLVPGYSAILTAVLPIIVTTIERGNYTTAVLKLVKIASADPANARNFGFANIHAWAASGMNGTANKIRSLCSEDPLGAVGKLLLEKLIVLLDLSSNLAAHVRAAAEHFYKKNIHREIILPTLRGFYADSDSSNFGYAKARSAAACVDLLTNMAVRCPAALYELVNSYKLEDILLIPIKAKEADPVCLGASYAGLARMLEAMNLSSLSAREMTQESKVFRDVFQYVSRTLVDAQMPFLKHLQLQGINSALIKSKASRDEEIQLTSGATNIRVSFTFGKRIDQLKDLRDVLVVELLEKVILFILFYLRNPSLEYSIALNTALVAQHRDKILLALMKVPNDNVRIAVLQCLKVVPLEAFGKEELESIVGLPSELKQVMSGRTLEVIQHLAEFLIKIVKDARKHVVTEKTLVQPIGYILRQNYLLKFFASVWELMGAIVESYYVGNVDSASEEGRARACNSLIYLLRIASLDSDMRPHLRTILSSEVFLRALAGEERLRATCVDICIERTWTGRQASLLTNLMERGGKTQVCTDGEVRKLGLGQKVTPAKKIAFRLLARLADVACGGTDYLEEDTSATLRDICEREMLWFQAENELVKSIYIMDDEEAEDRRNEMDELCKGGFLKTIINFLAKLIPSYEEADTRTKDNAEKRTIEFWAGRLKGKRDELEFSIKANTFEIDRERIRQNDDVPIDLDEEAVVSSVLFDKEPEGVTASEDADDTPGRWLILHGLQTVNEALSSVAGNQQAERLQLPSPTIWSNPAAGEMRPVYIVNAFLRLLYGLLVVPVSSESYVAAVHFLRVPHHIRLLTGLILGSGKDMGMVAKFCAVMWRAMIMEPHQPVESMDMIIVYGHVTRVLNTYAWGNLQILKKAMTKPLVALEEIYFAEMAKVLEVICVQTPYIKFSVFTRVQNWAVECALEKFILPRTVKCLCEIAVYNLMVAAGTIKGQMVAHLLEGHERRKSATHSVTEATISFLQSCNSRKFRTLRTFIETVVFGKQLIQQAYYYELINRLAILNYRVATERLKSEATKQSERFIVFEPVIRLGGKNKWQIIAISQYCIRYWDKPPAISAPDEGLVQDVAANRKTPRNEIIRHFKTVTRVVRGYPLSQVVHLGWSESLSAEDETFDSLVCPWPGSAERILQTVHALSGGNDSTRILIYNDLVMRHCFRQAIEKKIVHCSVGISKNPGKARTCVVLLLTDEDFVTINMNTESWFCPDPMAIREDSPWVFAGIDASIALPKRDVKKALQNFAAFETTDVEEADIGAARQTFKLQTVEEEGPLVGIPDSILTVGGRSPEANARAEFEKKMNSALSGNQPFLQVEETFSLAQLMSLDRREFDSPGLALKFRNPNPRYGKDKREKRFLEPRTFEFMCLSEQDRGDWTRSLAGLMHASDAAHHWHRLAAAPADAR